jgi:anti-sigma-K factor RskA
MDHDRLKELLPLEALGTLDGEDARAMAAHLSEGCDDCASELRWFREALAAMALATAGDGPADRIWQRLKQRLASGIAPSEADSGGPVPSGAGMRKDRSPGRATDRMVRSGVSRGWRIAAVAASSAAVILAIMMGDYAGQIAAIREESSAQMAALDRQARTLASELEDRNRELAMLRDQIAVSGQLTQAVLAPDARIIRLAPLQPAPDATGIVAVTPARNQAVLQVAGLPQPPPGKEYELWWIGSKSGPVKAALFAPALHGEATVASTLPPAGEQLLASAITLEPTGGVDKPTGAIYLKGAP